MKTLEAEVKSLQKFFKAWCEDNSFLNCDKDLSEYPLIKAQIQDFCSADGLQLHFKPTSFGAEMRPMRFDLQRHTISVMEHTDDVTPGVYFGILVLDNKKVVDTKFDSRSVLNYTSTDGRKRSARLEKNDILVLNPRKPHSLVFYGTSELLLLFSVKKNAKVKNG